MMVIRALTDTAQGDWNSRFIQIDVVYSYQPCQQWYISQLLYPVSGRPPQLLTKYVMWSLYLTLQNLVTRKRFQAAEYYIELSGVEQGTIAYLKSGSNNALMSGTAATMTSLPSATSIPNSNLNAVYAVKVSFGRNALSANAGYFTLAAALSYGGLAEPPDSEVVPPYLELDFPELDTSLQIWTHGTESSPTYGVLTRAIGRTAEIMQMEKQRKELAVQISSNGVVVADLSLNQGLSKGIPRIAIS